MKLNDARRAEHGDTIQAKHQITYFDHEIHKEVIAFAKGEKVVIEEIYGLVYYNKQFGFRNKTPYVIFSPDHFRLIAGSKK